MISKKKNTANSSKETQEDFLLSIKFLHGEALRLGMLDVALSLEEAIYQGATSIYTNEQQLIFLKNNFPEIYFTREFRKLAPEQQKLLLAFIDRVER